VTGDEAEVLATMDALYARAAQKDAEGLIELFAEDPDITFWGSEADEQALGPDHLREFMAELCASPTSFEFRWQDRRVRIEGDVAWVNAVGTCEWSTPDGERGTMPYRVTGVFVRRGGHWLWHTHNGSEPNAG
jgi:uncharacterized protein (TIGR02246 family)